MTTNEIGDAVENAVLEGTGANEECADDTLNDFKPEFQAGVRIWIEGTKTLIDVVTAIVDECDDGENTKEIVDTLVAWGEEVGADKKTLRETISRVLVGKGKRRNAKGQGRKAKFDEERLRAVIAFATEKFGDEVASALRAASDFAKKNKAA